MKSILVTGAAGFIGSHVCERILRDERFSKYSIIGLDNFDPFYSKRIKSRNLLKLKGDCRFKFIEGFSGNEALLTNIFRSHIVDGIIHLAARAGVASSVKDPTTYAHLNLMGSQALFHMAGKMGVNQFLFASSSSVYGQSSKVPFVESDLCLEPLSPYAATKRAGEILGWNAYHLYGLPFTCLRFFTVYGPRQRPEMAISKFTRSILKGRPVTIYGKGEMKRDFTYIDDIVSGVLGAYFWKKSFPHFEILNLGNSYTISVMELIRLIERLTRKKALRKFVPIPPGEMRITFANIRKARKYVNYSPKTSPLEGIASYIDWIKNPMIMDFKK